MKSFDNKLSAAQAERLAILLEELGEVQQAIGKILRHGYDSHNPEIDDPESNRIALETELAHVAFAVKLMIRSGDVNEIRIDVFCDAKEQKIQQWLHHQ